MHINKKGLSPIIATVVLLTLVVVLAGMIYKSGNEFITQLSPPADCSSVSFDAGLFRELDNTISLELTNTGNVIIYSIVLQISSNENSDNSELPILLNLGESVKQKINLEITEESKIRIIPEIKNAKDEISSCPDEFGKFVDLVQVSD